MLDSKEFALFLKEHIGLFAGVPDSLLKPLNSALNELISPNDFYTTANEGQAIAFASAYHLATKKLALVYMQNSGLGNAINPLLSLADELVYKISLVMFIGLRGGKDDEPQHKKQGLVTKDILKACGISYFILSKDLNEAKRQCEHAFKESLQNSKIIAVLVEKDSFTPFKSPLNSKTTASNLKREEAISIICENYKDAKFVCTTGHIGRECYDLRDKKGEKHDNDFLVVGSMGFASSIAFILSKYTKKQIICLDGDGAFLMHLGAVSNFKGSKFLHIVLNNFAHGSVGGQATNASNVDFVQIAKASGYEIAFRVSNEKDLKEKLKEIEGRNGLIFIEILVSKEARKDLGRPKDILALKQKFCEGLR